jgi:acyl transferase domain-containing protein
MNEQKSKPLAIIGLGCIFPKAENLNSFWSLIKNKVDAIEDIPESRWKIDDYYDPDPKAPDKTYVKKGGSVPTIDFNPIEFAVTPNALEGIDTSQLLSLVVSKKALQDAGYFEGKEFDRKKTSVIIGATGAQELVIPLGARLSHPLWRRVLKEAGIDEASAEKIVKRISEGYVEWQESSFPGLLGNVVAGRIANVFDFGGTNCAIDTACASSLSAVHLAALELEKGKSDIVLTGGVDTFNDIFMFMCFSKTPALSKSGEIRPFDHKADGTMLGEGIGIVILKRLEDAERDGDKIYALLRGVGTSSDGSGAAVFAPNSKGQVLAMQEAYENADINPRTVELMEAHGTGTKAGDVAEFNSINQVYEPASSDKKWCALGTIKSNIGHTKAAAGSAGLIKAAMALHHKVLPPTIKVEKPLQEIDDGKTPFYVNTEKRPWMPNPKHPRRAAVSAFGFGGSNFHCVLEEYKPEKKVIDWDYNVEIHAFSADSIDALKNKLDGEPSFNPNDSCRLVAACEKGKFDTSKIKSLLENNSEKKSWSTPDGTYFGSGPVKGKLGVLFPGQGSQYVGMMKDVACQFPQMHKVLSDANSLFHSNKSEEVKKDLIDYIYPQPVFDEESHSKNEDSLRDTRIAQPALGAVTFGAFKVLKYFGVKPEAYAGHSHGEISALCAAGRISAEELQSLSTKRGKLISESNDDLGSM